MTVLLTTRPISMPSREYLILVSFLFMLFATGGSSRADVQSLVFLHPTSLIVCALACLTLRGKHLVGRAEVLCGAATICLLALLHLVAVPPSIWQSIPGRSELLDIEMLADITSIWRPLALVPVSGWHALVSLVAPLAVILLGIQLNRNELFGLLPLVVVLATLSGLLGILQTIGDAQGPLYLYSTTNNGSAVGVFANRNHAATLLACLFPMLAVYASADEVGTYSKRPRRMVAAGIAVVVLPLILITGSRSGLISAIIGIGAAGLLYGPPTEVPKHRPHKPIPVGAFPILGGICAVGISVLTFLFSRAEAIERLFSQTSGDVSRDDFWAESLDLFWKFFPWGSGSGAYVQAYQMNHPDQLLNTTYLNHAHNDWVETLVSLGLPGAVALFVGLIFYSIRSYSLWKNIHDREPALALGRLASVIIAMLAIASVSDYPLRTPILMSLLAICALWMNEWGRVRPNVFTKK